MSGIRTDGPISTVAGGPVELTKQSAAKAWANLDGTGTIALRDSFNISSITDFGTGDYAYNFTASFANINWAATYAGGPFRISEQATKTVSAYRFGALNNSAVLTDYSEIMSAVHGDLA